MKTFIQSNGKIIAHEAKNDGLWIFLDQAMHIRNGHYKTKSNGRPSYVEKHLMWKNHFQMCLMSLRAYQRIYRPYQWRMRAVSVPIMIYKIYNKIILIRIFLLYHSVIFIIVVSHFICKRNVEACFYLKWFLLLSCDYNKP